jgi:diguanylate cyclase (GGDEF)-like protein
MTLDPRTLVACLAVSMCLFGAAVAVVAKAYPENLKRGANLWAAACLTQAAGWILIGLRDQISDGASIVAGNTALMLSGSLMYHALAELKREPVREGVVYAPAVIVLVSFVYLGLVAPNFIVRTILIAAFGAAQMAACARLLFDGTRRAVLVTDRLMGAAFLVCMATLTARGVDIVFNSGAQAQPGIFHVGAVQQATFMLIFGAIYLLSFGFLLMSNETLNIELVRLATLDALTEHYNRRTIDELGRREAERSRRARSPMSVAMLDLDHFKNINDTHGHSAGDATLRHVAAAIDGALRAPDLVGRYGGEEFLVILPNAGESAAARVADRLRDEIERSGLEIDGASVAVTASIGVATLTDGTADFDALVRAADEALYAAKARGRNCVVAASSLAPVA